MVTEIFWTEENGYELHQLNEDGTTIIIKTGETVEDLFKEE